MHALQLALAHGRRSLAPACVGLAAGILHQVNFLGVRGLSLRRLLRPLQGLVGLDPVTITIVAQQSGVSGQRHARAAGPGAARRRASVAASEGNVAQLVEMGFDEAAARAALQRHGNDVQQALGSLVN